MQKNEIGHRVTTVLCAAELAGSDRAPELLLDIAEAHGVDAVALIGNLGNSEPGATYVEVLRTLGRADVPTFCVPGGADAPIKDFVEQTQAVGAAHPAVHSVHGTLAFAPGYLLVQGLGGEVSDDLDTPKDEDTRLRYPRWEAEYRLRRPPELAEHELLWLLWSKPQNKERGIAGSEVLAELVSTERPRLVVSNGAPETHMLGRSLVVSPGSLSEGRYAVVDLRAQEAELQQAFIAA
jgi:Icc-related predicted phosphoesterase